MTLQCKTSSFHPSAQAQPSRTLKKISKRIIYYNKQAGQSETVSVVTLKV
ncbi:hypothetical protein SynA18461_00405 [Synechococcus sp. A18-46.1]|nr:hypothetical protein SynA18461_00405 [Synechococcus sp. A18-46.1]